MTDTNNAIDKIDIDKIAIDAPETKDKTDIRIKNRAKRSVVILIAEDDDDDFFLAQEAFEEYNLANEIHRVKNGEELINYLKHRGPYEQPTTSPSPVLILLDLNMPRMDGREALKAIKSDPNLRKIPVVIMTVSREEEDVIRSYELGANSYIRKPVRFSEMIEIIKTMGKYWFEIVELPSQEEGKPND